MHDAILAAPSPAWQQGDHDLTYLARVMRLREKVRRRMHVLNRQYCRLREIDLRCRMIELSPDHVEFMRRKPFRTFENYAPAEDSAA